MPSDNEALLKAILSVTARGTIPPENVQQIVMSRGATAKQLNAYNLCDGSRSQADIVKSLKLDAGNFSRTVGRWIEEGIVFKLGEGRDARLQHVYPLQPSNKGKKGDRE